MTFAHSYDISHARLRETDFAHYLAMKRGSEKLRDGILIARGLVSIDPPVRRARRKRIPPPPPPMINGMPVPIYETVAGIGEDMGIHPDHITGPVRHRSVMAARLVAYFVLTQRGNGLAQTGRWLGGRAHRSVTSGLKRFETHATDRMRRVAAKWIACSGDVA